jgi:hypothetical protein
VERAPSCQVHLGLGVVSVFLHSLVDFNLQLPAIAAWTFVLLGGVAAETHSPLTLKQPDEFP